MGNGFLSNGEEKVCSGHSTDWNIKITAQNCRTTQQKHRKANKGHGCAKLEKAEADYMWVNLKNLGPPLLSQFLCKWHLWYSEIILGRYVAVILPITNCCSANLKFSWLSSKIKKNHLKYSYLAPLSEWCNWFSLQFNNRVYHSYSNQTKWSQT